MRSLCRRGGRGLRRACKGGRGIGGGLGLSNVEGESVGTAVGPAWSGDQPAGVMYGGSRAGPRPAYGSAERGGA